MKMMDDWIHIRLVVKETPGIALPEGYEHNPEGLDTIFEVIDIGPAIKKVKPGDHLVVSFMSGMHKFKVPEQRVATYGVRESDIIGIINKAPINRPNVGIIIKE